MDLPPDVWGTIRLRMTSKEWAKACRTNRASFAMRWRAGLAKLRSKRAGHRHLCMGQLQLHRWRACHSLHLSMWQLGKDVRLNAAQLKKLHTASEALPLLQCLHLVGRDVVTLTESSIEGILIRLLARHAPVLRLVCKTITMPLGFLPNVQHLLLDLDAIATRQTHGSFFTAISSLKGLKTLYLQSAENALSGTTATDRAADLSPCVHLQHVVLPGFQTRWCASPSGRLSLACNRCALLSGHRPRLFQPPYHRSVVAAHVSHEDR